MMEGEDDDDMADLFSFGTDMEPPAPAPNNVTTPTFATATPTATDTGMSEIDELFQDNSDDSFLRMLDEHPLPSKTTNSNGKENETTTTNGGDMDALMNDPETQDIMSWLEEEDTDADALLAAVADESAIKAQKKQQQQQPQPAAPKEEKPVAPAPPPAPVYESLQQVLEAPEATKLQILEHWEQTEKCQLKDHQLRPLLWCRIICGKTLDELSASSLADSFQAFLESDNTPTTNAGLEGWIRTESAKLAPRIVRANPNGMRVNEAEEALQSILLYHYHSNATKDNSVDPATDNSQNSTTPSQDPLLPPVVCAILSAGVPKLAAPVLMSHIVPSFMPFVALTPEERWEASKLLHSQFYLLACYHLPMLVYHLDRYVPGWYWPQRGEDEKENHSEAHRGRHLRDQGVIPPSWLMTHLVGECGGNFLDPNRLLQLLDLVFTNENNSLRFFLVLAVLEQHSDTWLELTGKELMDSLYQHMQDSSALTMEEWAARARAMKQATPDSVVDRLRTAEDEAVKSALKERQKKAEAALKARLEAEAAAHREAQERKAEEARTRLTRARLVAYYRRHAPSKEANIDRIMEAYKDNFEVLDNKLRKKYGVGFNPAINPNKKKKTMTETANESMKKTMQSMNEGIKRMASSSSPESSPAKRPDNPLDEHEDTDEIRKKEHRVSVSVKVGETLPYICMTREQANDIRRVCLQKDLPMPLRFYLVDGRSEEVAEKQGRFPTAARLSPETLQDPELLQQYEDSFEAVRGSVHIVVMGEGYSAIPALYNQKLTPALEEYMREDESKTNGCALSFVKRGFPFVSVLEGGFASAHAWLVREGPKKGFNVKALLVDYNPDVSLFAQMEKVKKEQVGYKAQRALHSLLEASIPDSVRGRSALDGKLADANDNAESGKEQGKASEENTARGPLSFFGRRQQQVAPDKQPSKPEEMSNDAGDAPAAGPGIAASLFGRRQQAAEQQQTDNKNESSTTGDAPAAGPGIAASLFGRRQQATEQPGPNSDKSESPAAAEGEKDESKNEGETAAPEQAPSPAPAASAPGPAAPAQNRFGRWRQAAASAINASDEAAQPEQGQNKQQGQPGNRFGAAFGMLRSTSQDNSTENAANKKQQPMLRRNPFARFGGGGGAAGANKGAGAAPPGSEAARAAMTTATSAFGGLMKAANNAKPNFARSASNELGPDKAREQHATQNGGATVVALPPRPDETEESVSFVANGDKNQEEKKAEPTLRAV